LLDKHFNVSAYSLRTLFRDEQRKILSYILESTLSEIETAFRQIYEYHYPPMRFLTDLGNPLPKAFSSAAEFILNTDLRKALSGEALDVERIMYLIDEATAWNVALDNDGLGYLLQQTLGAIMTRFVSDPEDMALLEETADAGRLAKSVPFNVDLWKVQNLYYEMIQVKRPEFQKRAEEGDKAAGERLNQLISLGQQLLIRGT